MKNFIYRGRVVSTVGFFGLGSSNEALLRHLSSLYPHLSFILRSDREIPSPPWAKATLTRGGARENFFEDVLFLSPSVRRDAPEFKAAEKCGLIISSDIEFFFESKKIPIYAITGSDGKSTTTALTSLILGENEYPPSANYGNPISDLLSDGSVLGTVAELSSFQLMDFTYSAQRALITNISQNHLDWHKSMDEYVCAKENLIRFSEKKIFNFDCPYSRALLERYPAFSIFSSEKSYREIEKVAPANHYFTVEDGCVCHSGRHLFHVSEISLRGEHNLKNLLAAAAMTVELRDADALLRAARSFSGLRHRCEIVFERGGVTFLDSSIDSTPARTKTTLKEITSPTVLILGGRGKGLSYKELLPLPSCLCAVIITGENRLEIFDAISHDAHGIKITVEEDFERAVILAIRSAKEGDNVLLSPASTSYDRFSNYKERASFFKETIKNYYAGK